MLKILRANKIAFYAFITIWFIAGTVIFNYSVINAQTQVNPNDSIRYMRLFSEVLLRLRLTYVDELQIGDLIQNAIDGMVESVDTDSTFILTDDYHNIVAAFTQGELPDPRHPQYDRIMIDRNLRYFNDMLMSLQANFGEDFTTQEMIEFAIEGMLSDLDPHTNFFKPKAFSDFTEKTVGEFGGLGIQIDRQGDYVIVVSPIEGTPAYKMGIQSGDKIAVVDDENVIGMTTDEVIKRMRGPAGTKVSVGIERYGVEGILTFEIIRDIIKLKSVPYAMKLDNGVGYVKIREFNANTTVELRQALDYLEGEGIRGLLIDLRFNGGGLLNEAVDTVNEFIGPSKRVVFTKGRMPQANTTHYTRYNRARSGYPVVVLVNQASASASEIFAGSIQDYDVGIVVGMPTFGKGSVQQLYPLSDNYGIKITTSKYYINSGRCIHKDELDMLLRGQTLSDEEKEAIDKENNEHIYYTVNGREVKGGGGIIPEIEIDQTRMTKLEMDIRRLNLFNEYAIDYYARHKDEINLSFRPDDAMIQDFMALAVEKGLTYEPAELDSAYTFIKLSLAKDIIDKKFGEQEGYRVALELDDQLMQAIALFDKFSTIEEMLAYSQ